MSQNRVEIRPTRRGLRVPALACALIAAVAPNHPPATAAAAADKPAGAAPAAPAAPTAGPASTQPAQSIVAIGVVEAFWSADQYAKTSGYVADVKADIGDHVKKGQLLAVIDVPELENDLAVAKAMLAAKQEMAKAAAAAIVQAQKAVEVAKQQQAGAEAELELANTTLKRQEELFAGKAATSQQIDEARAKTQLARAASGVSGAKIAAAEADLMAAAANEAVAAANAQVAAAEAQRAETMLAYTRIVAPFDGTVTRRQVSPGDLVQSAAASRANPLFTVQRIDTVRVFCDVPEAAAMLVRVGDPAEVKLYGAGGSVIRGEVTRIATAVNSGTRTMRAEVDLPNPGERLRPGMYAQVTLSPREPTPAAAAAAAAPAR